MQLPNLVAAETRERLLFAEYGRTLIIRPTPDEDTNALFEQICSDFGNTKIEQDTDGNVYIMSPVGGESSDQNSELTMQLRFWAKQDGRGRAFDSSVLFRLPDHSSLGPDGAWVSRAKLAELSRSERRKFLRIVPEFVVELMSPSDRLVELERKMEQWIANGVELGWLIQPDKRRAMIYRRSIPRVDVVYESSIAGDGPVEGFTLDLQPIWDGLDF